MRPPTAACLVLHSGHGAASASSAAAAVRASRLNGLTSSRSSATTRHVAAARPRTSAIGRKMPPLTTDALTSHQQRELWRAVATRVNFWETLDEIEPGSLARLFRLMQERKWEIIFLTSRPETSGATSR